jgi:hypothetical protein
MYIKLKIIDNRQREYNKPSEYIFKDNYAIETMLIKISFIYFGKEVSLKIEDLLKTRIDNSGGF